MRTNGSSLRSAWASNRRGLDSRMGKLLARFARPFGAKIALGMSTKVVEVVFDLITPLVIARMIDRGVASKDASVLLRYGALLLAFALLGYCFTLVCQKMAALVSQGMGTNLRDALMQRIMGLSVADVSRFGTPSLVTRVTSDVNQVQLAVALAIRQLVRFPILAMGSMVAALLIDLRLGLVFLACVPAIILVFWFVMSRSVPYFSRIQETLDRLSLICRESLSGVRVIRAFRREDFEDGLFREASGAQAQLAVASGRLSALLSPSTFLIMNLGIVAILWNGGVRIDAGGLSQGQVMAFVNYMTQTLVAIAYVANLVVVFNKGAASASRIEEVLETSPSVVENADRDISVDPAAELLELENVSFSFDASATPALSGVTLSLGRGETLGVIGGTGSGKSTLANLLLRLHDPSSGSLRLMGNELADYPLGQLRSLVSLVPQHASLVSGSIRSNLSWRNPDASDDDLWKALELAQAADFVRAKPSGLDEAVEAGGRNFSGGQRQRLTIARALVGSPRLVVLDDSASALDFKTDAALRGSLRTLGEGTTSIIISQRVSSVMQADKILVLDHGRMVGLASHFELLETCPLYREICLSQLSREELGA